MEISNYANVNWSTLASQIANDAGLTGVKAAEGTLDADGNLTLTFVGENGKTQTLTMTAPELDEATGQLTEEGLEALEQKINGAFGALKDLMANPPKAGGTNTAELLFDIYSLMQLMQEIAKSQKEVATKSRHAELQRATADIHSKAAQQKTAAKLGLWMSIGFSAASIGVQAVSAGMSAKAQNAANKLEASSGVDQVQQNLNLLSAKNSVETGKNLQAATKGMTDTQLNEAKGFFADSNTAENAYKTAVAQRDAFKTVEGDISQKQERVNTLQNEIDELGQNQQDVPQAKRDELAQARTALQDAQNGRADNLREAHVPADATLQGLEDEVTGKQQAWARQLNADQGRLEAKLGAKELELTQLEDADHPVDADDGHELTKAEREQKISALKTEIKTLKAQVKWGKAYVVDTKMREPALSASLAADIVSTEESLDKKAKRLKFDAQYKAAEASGRAWGTVGNIFEQLGRALTAVTQGATGMKEAAASEFDATAKSDEAAMQESADLVNSAQELIRAVMDLLRAVLAAENQSINQIVA